MSFAELTYAVADRVATITLNRPERLNAWTPTMAAELRQAIGAAAADAQVRAVILTGAGRGFCAGADIALLERRAEGALPWADPALNRFDYLLDLDKPLVMAVNGPVAGIGLVLTLYGDIRFLAAGAKLSTSFARRGLPAEGGSAWLLQRLVGPMHAADLLLSGRVLLAEEAAAMGFGRLLPPERFLETVTGWTSDLANLSSPRSMRVIKRQLRAAWSQTLQQAADRSDQELAEARETDDFREGVAHHVEKRPPAFGDP